ncbi:uncharacterized protein METZ01_LOCUS2369 [marine metagenome]|uniref:Uncharacterized protein n=1 Tax=marine metagenome TaxID=408172 RepID=A0A381N4Q7_9ZZZZ
MSFYDNRLLSHIMATDKRHKAIITIINGSVGKLVIPADTGIQGSLCYTCLNLVIFNTWLSFQRKQVFRGVTTKFSHQFCVVRNG